MVLRGQCFLHIFLASEFVSLCILHLGVHLESVKALGLLLGNVAPLCHHGTRILPLWISTNSFTTSKEEGGNAQCNDEDLGRAWGQS